MPALCIPHSHLTRLALSSWPSLWQRFPRPRRVGIENDCGPLEAGRDYQLVTISIDPRDTPSDALAARAKYIGLLDHRRVGSGIHFLTAAAASEVREIAEASQRLILAMGSNSTVPPVDGFGRMGARRGRRSPIGKVR